MRFILGISMFLLAWGIFFASQQSIAFANTTASASIHGSSGSVDQAFGQASQEFGVPSALLKAICYMEGRLSNHGGNPSVDQGFGCMHLIKNHNGDTLVVSPV